MMDLYRRGGSWYGDDGYCKMHYQLDSSASYRDNNVGFRLYMGGDMT